MPSKKPSVKKATSKKIVKKAVKKSEPVEITPVSFIPGLIHKTKKSVREFQSRRPHKSFRRTRRRDYARSLQLPGFIGFTREVYKTLWAHKRLFFSLVILYAILTAAMVSIPSQSTYTALTTTLKESSGSILSGGWGELGKASLLFISAVNGSISQNLSQQQQIYAAILGLMAWLVTVWLLRNVLAGNKVRLRDGVYSSGAPIASTFVVAVVLVLQLLPIALALIGYSAAKRTGLFDNGIEGLLFFVSAGLLVVLSLYWITSTLFALVIITLPGMYPYRAIRTAGDLVIGRRMRILLRFLWMLLVVIVAWIVVMIPIILLDLGIKNIIPAIEAFPIVPIALLLMSSLSILWVSSYVYLLYRKVVADDASPA